MGIPIRVLIVEDSTDDAELVLLQLRRAGYDPAAERVQTAEDMKTALERETWDLVVSDYTMPQFDAPTALKLLNQSGLDIPFIVVSGSIGEDIAVAMMKTGAHDYVLKQNLTRLVSAVQRELREAENRRQQRLTEQAKERLQIERDALLERLKQENEDLAALTQVTANAISTLELDDLLRVLLQRVMEVMHADTATILLAEGAELQVRASVGAVNLRDSTHVKLVGQCFAGAVAERMKPVYVEDAAVDPLITDPLIRERGIRSMLGVPLKRNGVLIGVLHADWLRVRPRREREVQLLEITAERCAAAIRNAQLYREAKRVAAALTESEARLRQLSSAIEQTADSVVITDREGTIQYVNAAFEKATGYSTAEAVGRKPSLLKSGQHKPEFFEDLWRTITAGEPFRAVFVNRHKSGALVYEEATITPIKDQRGDTTHFVSTAKDITERKRAEDALRDSEDRYQAIVEDQNEFICRWSFTEGVTFINEAGCRYLSLPRSAILGRSFEPYVHEEDRKALQEHIASLRPEAPVGASEHRVRLPTGEVRWTQWTDHAFFDASGRPLAFQSVGRDITERKQADEALRASLREKEALLKEVHHRVKNNLQVITSLLRLETSRSAEAAARTVLKEMQGRVQSMALLHETLYRSGVFASVDLGAYLKQLAAHSIRALSGQPGSIQLDLDLAPVRVDMDQAIPCGLLVNELISNCLKHAFPEGRTGRIRVELRQIDGGPQLLLSVSDTGVGLPADFEARRGRSLGLQLVSDLAKQLGGRLEVGPAPSAAFTVTFAVGAAKE